MAARTPHLTTRHEFAVAVTLTLDVPPAVLDALIKFTPAHTIELERRLAVANADIKKIRKAIDRIKADEVKEDADAEAYRTEKEAKIAELTAKVAELEAQPKLDAEDQAALVAMREELEALSPPPAEPTEPPAPEPEPAPPEPAPSIEPEV